MDPRDPYPSDPFSQLVVYGENQPGVRPLPVRIDGHMLVTAWKPNPIERRELADHAHVIVSIQSPAHILFPMRVQVQGVVDGSERTDANFVALHRLAVLAQQLVDDLGGEEDGPVDYKVSGKADVWPAFVAAVKACG